MKAIHQGNHQTSPILLSRCITILILFSLALTACSMPSSVDTDATQDTLNLQGTELALRETQTELDAQNAQRDNDIQATQDALSATQMAIELMATQDSLAATQMAMDTLATENAEELPTPTEEPTSIPPTPTPRASFPDFETWMRSEANILLFEDMTGARDVYTYIDKTLDGMGLNYVDMGDALGDYKDQILSRGPGRRGWDLIISGKEFRKGVQGEFYVYFNDALDEGTSIIIEEWDMDAIISGKLGTIMNRCGVKFYRDWIGQPLSKQLLFQINPNHPIHNTPNTGIALTNPSMYWACTDLGDLMELAPGSNATPLWGALVNNKTTQLTAVACMDGQLIVQTYSTHSYGEDRIQKMWENYIYNALKTRYDRITP